MSEAIRKSTLFFVCLSGIIVPNFICSVQANDSLIGELESLRRTLRAGDPGRSTLTRRLADMYFDTAISMDKDNILAGVVTPQRNLKRIVKRPSPCITRR